MNGKYVIVVLSAIVVCLAAQNVQADAYGNQHQINITGATSFDSFFSAPASTNDDIDVDGDGNYQFNIMNFNTPDQLAWSNWQSMDPNNRWIVDYRGVGSGNGLAELVTYHNTKPGPELALPQKARINRAYYFSSGAPTGDANPANPGDAPTPINNIDIAIMDAPTVWMIQSLSGSNADAAWNLTPGENGYGRYGLNSWNGPFLSSGQFVQQPNHLVPLTSAIDANLALNLNTSTPDSNTIFDTSLAWVPIMIIANPGTGLQNVTEAQLQYLFMTGRMPSGENLIVVTRDPGSGTRGSGMNDLGMDPSWARGDNLGLKDPLFPTAGQLGPDNHWGNLDGGSLMRKSIQADRLGVGYLGLGDTLSDTTGYEILNVKKTGSTTFVRPSLNSILDNANINTGYQIGGSETLATVGNPFGIPAMSNTYAHDYINNIITSVSQFVSTPSNVSLDGMPGEWLASNTTCVLQTAIQAVPTIANPSVFVANPNYNSAVNAWTLANSVISIPAYGSYGNGAGKVPTREVLTGGKTYSDGLTGSENYYIASDGSHPTYGSVMSRRNKICGDFNFDGQLDINDADSMMLAFSNPRNFEHNNNNGGAGYVIVEVIGDFTGDGNFDTNDIRYWADGLALDKGNLNRSEGFALVDTKWTAARAAALGGTAHPAGNFFNTTLATGRPYQLNSGWSKADIAGSGMLTANGSKIITPGALCVGADGKIDAHDIDYLHYVLRSGIQAQAEGIKLPVNYNVHNNVWDWNNVNNAIWMDLTCDLDGDMKITGADVDLLVNGILGTRYGDVNLDGSLTSADRATIVANMDGKDGKSWSDGDFDGDGYVTANDLAIFDWNRLANIASNWLATGCSAPGYCQGADINQDGKVDFKDYALAVQNWLNP